MRFSALNQGAHKYPRLLNQLALGQRTPGLTTPGNAAEAVPAKTLPRTGRDFRGFERDFSAAKGRDAHQLAHLVDYLLGLVSLLAIPVLIPRRGSMSLEMGLEHGAGSFALPMPYSSSRPRQALNATKNGALTVSDLG